MPGCRRNLSLITKSGTTLGVGSYYLVNVLAPGGIATGPPSGGTIFLHGGHGLQVGQKILVYSFASGVFQYLPGSPILSRTDTTIALSGAPPLLVITGGDLVFNMGADNSATSAPNWNGQGTSIFSNNELTLPISNQQVAADENGAGGYWWSGQRVWEIYRNPDSGSIFGYEIDIASGSAADASGDTLPDQGDYLGQSFHLNAQNGEGGIDYWWAEDSNGVPHWEVRIRVA